MDAADERQVAEVVRLLREVVGPELVGAYLYGSAVLGGLRPRSDLDVLALTARRTTDGERARLAGGLLAASGRGAGSGRRPLELTVVAVPDVRPWRFPPVQDLQYGEWLRDRFEQGRVPAAAPSADLAMLLTIATRHGVALAGPAAGEVLEPVPPDDLRRALLACTDELVPDLEDDTRNVLLTLPRVWCTLATGQILPKDEAADWALGRLDAAHRPPLAHARAVYLGLAEERWGDHGRQLRPLADALVTAIQRATAAGRRPDATPG